jgi:hypothetical protein
LIALAFEADTGFPDSHDISRCPDVGRRVAIDQQQIGAQTHRDADP